MSTPPTGLRPYKNTLPELHHSVYIDPAAVIIGDVHIGQDSSVWPLVVIRGDVNRVSIGARSNIQDGSVIHESRRRAENPEGYPTTLGSDVTVGHKALLHGCSIGDRVMVGMGAIVLDGAIIEDDVIVGAGALVTPGKVLSSGYLYTGSPARPARALHNTEREELVTNARHYIQLKNEYLNAS